MSQRRRLSTFCEHRRLKRTDPSCNEFGKSMRCTKGTSLIELMVAILILAILAAGLAPIFRARTDAAKWSEGKATCGTIATALRAYVALEGDKAVAVPTPTQLGLPPGGLDGTYFSGTDFEWIINSTDPLDYVITATAPAGIKHPSQITLDHTGEWNAID